jgi:hypothetical protein
MHPGEVEILLENYKHLFHFTKRTQLAASYEELCRVTEENSKAPQHAKPSMKVPLQEHNTQIISLTVLSSFIGHANIRTAS